MIYKIQHGKTDTPTFIDIPPDVANCRPELGQIFEVGISSDGGKSYRREKACFVADGRSLMVGHHIVRFGTRLQAKRNHQWRSAFGGVVVDETVTVQPVRPVEPVKAAGNANGGDLKAPMTGKLISIAVQEGQNVQEGDVLVVIEAMKMENRIVSEWAGVVRNIRAEAGKSVTVGENLLSIQPVGGS